MGVVYMLLDAPTTDIKAKFTMLMFSQKCSEWYIFLQIGNGFVCKNAYIPNGMKKSS